MVISIVIDSDRGHCYEHFKKNQITMKIEPVTSIWMFVCAMNFWAARKGKKMKFWTFQAQPTRVGVFHAYFVCKCSFREISMIKIAILDQSKPISLILKIKNSKIRNLYIARLLFIKTEIRRVYDPF